MSPVIPPWSRLPSSLTQTIQDLLSDSPTTDLTSCCSERLCLSTLPTHCLLQQSSQNAVLQNIRTDFSVQTPSKSFPSHSDKKYPKHPEGPKDLTSCHFSDSNHSLSSLLFMYVEIHDHCGSILHSGLYLVDKTNCTVLADLSKISYLLGKNFSRAVQTAVLFKDYAKTFLSQ